MAKLKISEVSGRVNTGNVVRASQLALPMSLATNQAAGFQMFGKAIKELYAAQKTEEDTNEATEIINSLSIDLIQSYNKHSNNTNLEIALEGFNADLNYNNFKDLGSNNAVKKQIKKYTTDFKRKYSLDLLSAVTLKHKELTSANKQQKLNLYIKDMSGSDATAAAIASRNYNNFWIDPQNLAYYGPKKLEELKAKSDLQILELAFINKGERGEINLLDNDERAAILAALPVESQKPVIDKIRNTNLSEKIKLDEEIIFKEKQDKKLKMATFITALLAMNDHRLNPSDETFSKLPSLDDLYDLQNSGALNSSQYETLLKFKAEGGKTLSDPVIEQIVNAEFALANTVEKLDAIQESVNLDPSITNNLSPKSIIKYNALFEKYKVDQTFAQEDKKFRELLEIGSRKIGTSGGINFSAFNVKKGDYDFLVRAEARMDEYDDLTLNKNYKPEQAYEEVIKKLSKDELPELHDLTQPSSVNIKDFKENLNAHPKNTFIDMRDEVAVAFKKHGNIEQYKDDLKYIDRIEDVFDVRITIFNGDIKKALGKELKTK
tara:strand:+ start:1862 stop:3508 length:1647 start_codon:yes stop_codon:yes gene_type:complete